MNYAEPVARRTDSGWKVEILHDGASISRLWIVDRAMRIGNAVVNVGGIAGVGTDRQHRNRGLALRVLRRTNELMTLEGYDASFLFGIQDFYHRVGFATCMPEHGLALDTLAAERAQGKLKVRRMRQVDVPRVGCVYERDNATRTASVVRSRKWTGFPMGSGFDKTGVARIVHAGGDPDRVLGYLLYDDVPDRCRAAEVGGSGDDVHAVILATLARRAVALRREHISASVPVDHPFALYCRRYGVRDETRYPREAGAMGRIIDLSRFARAMVPEWCRRWPAQAVDRMILHTDIGSLALRRQRNGRVVVGTTSAGQGSRLRVSDQSVLMQLAMGYRGADDAAAAGRLSGTKAVLELARALFPVRVAHMWWPDRF